MGRQVDAAIDELGARVRGEVLTSDDTGYDDSRSVWNSMIDRRPGVIVRCRGAADVIAAVNAARDHDLELSIKGGGHNVAGRAVTDGGLMIDCAPMHAVRVDPRRRVARVQTGAQLGDLDHETQAFGLVTPVGQVSETGLAGLALGGGFGWISRKHGLSVDNIRAVDVVTADGSLVHADEDEHPDLFWGVRGGSSNFGVVTSIEFDLHPLDPQILAGTVVHPHEGAGEVLRHWRDFMTDAPDEVGSIAVFVQIPADPAMPEELHGQTVLVLGLAYAGPPATGEQVLAGLRGVGTPLVDTVQPMPYVALQQLFDEQYRPRRRRYVKSNFLSSLPDEAIDIATTHAATVPNATSNLGFVAWGGAINRVPSDTVAFPHRDVAFEFDVEAAWDDTADDERHTAWARGLHEAMAPHVTGGVYGNIPSEQRAGDAYVGNYERLARIKATWDPDNLFRLNQNVEPAT